MSQLLTTASVEPRDRLSYWVDAVCSTYVQLDCDAPGADGRSTARSAPTVSRHSSCRASPPPPSTCAARRRASRAAGEDYFLVSIQTQGSGAVLQDGRRADLQPGDFALYDSTRPYELIFDRPFQQYVLMLPGATLRTQLRDTQKLTAQRVSGARGAGHLMIGMIRTLADDIDTLEPASAAAVADSVNNILLAGLSTLPSTQHSRRCHS